MKIVLPQHPKKKDKMTTKCKLIFFYKYSEISLIQMSRLKWSDIYRNIFFTDADTTENSWNLLLTFYPAIYLSTVVSFSSPLSLSVYNSPETIG